jgi:hypothetical protein
MEVQDHLPDHLLDHLLVLPREVLSSILAHLPIGDVARALRTCVSLAQLAEHTTLWSDVLVRYCGLEVADPSTAAQTLKLISSSPPLRLKFVGTLTDGGIDASYEPELDDDAQAPVEALDRDLQYWAGSLFDPAPWLLYCSASGRVDVTCAAVLDGLHDWLAEEREQARRAFMLDRLARIASDWWGVPIDGFGGLANASSQVLDEAFLAAIQVNMPMLLHGLTSAEERDWYSIKIQRTGAQIAERAFALRRDGPPRLRTVQRAGVTFTVDAELPVFAQPRELAVACRLILRRSLSCSCPASHGVIYASRERLESDAFYDGIPALGCATGDVLIDDDGGWVGYGRGAIDGLGAIIARTRSAEGEVLELAPRPPAAGSHGLCPIAVFSFAPLPAGKLGVHDPDVHQLVHTLTHPRCVRTLVVKLLRAEDRMSACDDDHPEMNIDFEYVGLDGHTFCQDFLRNNALHEARGRMPLSAPS